MTHQLFQPLNLQPSTIVLSSAKNSVSSIPKLITTCTNSKPMVLPNDFEPRDIDILCGRGRGVWDHPGNRRFKILIEAHVEEYKMARNKIDKSVVIASMVDHIREQGVLFVKKDAATQRWFDIGEYQARDKTGHAVRDHISKSCSIRKSGQNSTKPNQQKKRQNGEKKRNQQSTEVQSVTQQQHPQPQMQIQLQSKQCDSISSPSGFTLSPSIDANNATVPRRISDDSVSNFETHRAGLEHLFESGEEEFEKETKCEKMMIEKRTVILNELGNMQRNSYEFQNCTVNIVRDEEEYLQWSEIFPLDFLDYF